MVSCRDPLETPRALSITVGAPSSPTGSTTGLARPVTQPSTRTPIDWGSQSIKLIHQALKQKGLGNLGPAHCGP